MMIILIEKDEEEAEKFLQHELSQVQLSWRLIWRFWFL